MGVGKSIVANNNLTEIPDHRQEVVGQPSTPFLLRDGRKGHLRPARPGDGTNLRRLIHMAHPNVPDDHPDKLCAAVDESPYPDLYGEILQRRSTGKQARADSLLRMRIADVEGTCAAMAYAAPPMIWIPDQLKAGISLRHVAQLAERLTELELLATLPAYRGRRLASRLFDDMVEAYTNAGYTAMMVMLLDTTDRDVAHWYHDRGFFFAPWGHPWMIVPWAGRQIGIAYDHVKPGQRVGFKALAGSVSVESVQPPPSVFGGRKGPAISVCAGLLD